MTALPLFFCSVDESGRAAVSAVLESGALAAGGAIGRLESALEERFQGRAVVAMSDATHAIAMALTLSGVRRGDEVMVVSFNCLSSTAGIALVGAVPIWIDIDPETAVVDVSDCKRAISKRTKALVVYHIAGYPAPMERLQALCEENGIALIEDANNALGATLGGKPVGSFGSFAVVSFYANRQVNAIEGAALICNDSDDADRARRLRRYGIESKTFRDGDGEIRDSTDIIDLGMSAPMLNTNAALGIHNLKSLDERLAKVQYNVSYMTHEIRSITKIRVVPPIQTAVPAYWVWLLRCRDRDQLSRCLRESGIGCSKLHRPNHTYSGFKGRTRPLPGTSEFYQDLIALPSGWWLGAPDLDRIVMAIRQFRDN